MLSITRIKRGVSEIAIVVNPSAATEWDEYQAAANEARAEFGEEWADVIAEDYMTLLHLVDGVWRVAATIYPGNELVESLGPDSVVMEAWRPAVTLNESAHRVV
jgi:hypothetical protein